MLSRTYAILDDAQKGPLLELEQAALIVACNTPNTNKNRMVRGSVGRSSGAGGIYGFECVFYGTDTLANYCSVGIAGPDTTLSTYAGGTGVNNIALLPGDGAIYQNGASVIVTEPYGQKVIFTVVADFSNPGFPLAWFYADGALIDSLAIPMGTYYPAVTVGSPGAAYELRAFCNFGQRKMKRQVLNSASELIDGWYAGRVAPRAVRLTPSDSGGANVKDSTGDPLSYQPRIVNADSFSIARRCSPWTQRGRTSGTSFGQLELDNSDGEYDDLILSDYRDSVFRVSVVEAQHQKVAYDDADRIVLATGIVDRIDGVGEEAVRITVKDALAKRQKPLQNDFILPYYDEGAANSTMPLTLGACRNVEPILIDGVQHLRIAHDAPLTNIAMVRDKGAPLSPYSNPPQYVPSEELNGITTYVEPVGKLTMDVSSVGAQIVIPGAADVLNGEGEFSTWPVAGDPPTGWTGSVLPATGTRTRIGAGSPYQARLTTSVFYEGSGGFFGIWLKTSTNVFTPGRNYRITFKIAAATGGTSAFGDQGIHYGLMLRTTLNTSPNGAITPNMRPVYVPNTTGFENYTFTYQCPAGAALPLYLIVTAPQGTVTGVGYGPGSVTVHDVRIELLGNVTQTLPLEGITFEDYYREIFNRAGVPQSEWWLGDASNLDSPITLPNRQQVQRKFGIHIRAGEQFSEYDALMAPMTQITGAVFTDANGVIRLRELIDPRWYSRPGAPIETIAAVATFTTADIRSGVEMMPDLAPGLTNAVGARKNWSRYSDSDFVTDLDTVPAALQAQFKREFQLQSTSAYSLNSSYQHAVNAPPLPTLFDDLDIAEAMRDRTLYSYSTALDSPRFVKFTVYFDDVDDVPIMYFGDYVDIQYPRFGFTEATNFRVVIDTVYWPHAGIVEVVAWGGT